jgi:hypothetical protein
MADYNQRPFVLLSWDESCLQIPYVVLQTGTQRIAAGGIQDHHPVKILLFVRTQPAFTGDGQHGQNQDK